MNRPVTVDFFFAPTSRYSYLASTRVLPLQLETGCRVDWYPLHLADLQAAAGHDVVMYGRLASGQYDGAWRREDATAWADLYGVPYRDPTGITVPEPRRLALACVAARRLDAGQVFARRLFQAAFVDGTTPLDDAALGQIGHEVTGLDPADLMALIADPETEAEHRRIVKRARDAGAFGVPSFAVGARMIWGQDRLPLVRRAIEAAKAEAA
jgi:2-hydroxychromene-2-carboxylate isomerase